MITNQNNFLDPPPSSVGGSAGGLLRPPRFDSRHLRLVGRIVPMIDRLLPRHGTVLRATRFYPAVTSASLSCEGSMVSGRKSAHAAGRGPIEHRVRRCGADGRMPLT
ncbi:hypothetical protein Hanom_Chr04g00367091 [Helianthus anomalus]